jgi:hypothetical protein
VPSAAGAGLDERRVIAGRKRKPERRRDSRKRSAVRESGEEV